MTGYKVINQSFFTKKQLLLIYEKRIDNFKPPKNKECIWVNIPFWLSGTAELQLERITKYHKKSTYGEGLYCVLTYIKEKNL